MSGVRSPLFAPRTPERPGEDAHRCACGGHGAETPSIAPDTLLSAAGNRYREETGETLDLQSVPDAEKAAVATRIAQACAKGDPQSWKDE